MRIVFVSVFLFLTLILNAQTNTYLADLAALKSIVQKTASFKAQIKGDKLSYYNDLYKRLDSDTISNPNSYRYFYNLSQLLFPLRDNHLAFYQLPNYSNFKTKESIDNFIATKEFLDYPMYNINFDSLKTALDKKPAESVEGIYHYDKFYTVALFKKGDKEYIGVVLDSDTSLWVKGQIAIHLYESAPNIYKAIYGHPFFKYFMLQPVEKYQNQSLVNSFFYDSYSQNVYLKQLRQVDYVNLPKSSSKFALKSINDDVQYLLIQTFQTNTTTAQTSQRFYDSIKTLLKAPHLILDLRNNEGGAEKEMKKYLKLLKEYVKDGHLHVLVNNGTLSQAEIFTLELKRLKNVTTIGQQTKGMLSYGSNYGKRERLPSGRFEIYPTDMNSGSALLQFEDYGIKPDVNLGDDKDWIQQVVEMIRKK
ncbi:MAG: S41 family peptidase [Sediminibacterium sp.]